MKWTQRCVFCCLLAATPFEATAAQGQAGRSNGTLSDSLTRLYGRFLTGIRLRDTLSYKTLLTPDYSYVSEDSAVVLRGRSARLRRDAESSDRWDLFDVERCDISIHGNRAVGPCWYHVTGLAGGQRGDWHGISLVTFTRNDTGQWQIAATRTSVVNPK